MGDAIGTGVTEDAVEGGYEEATKARLQAELRHRGLSDAGDTDELIERLREDDREQAEDTAQDDEAGDEQASSTEAGEDADADGDVEADDEPASEDPPEAPASADEEPSDDEAGASEGSSSKGSPPAKEKSSKRQRSSSKARSKERRQQPRGRSSPRRRLVHDPPLRRAAQLVSRSTGLKVDTVSRAVHEDGAWYVQVELVEVPHVPPSRDILGSYVVVIGDDGVVRALERMAQYRRKA